MLWAFKFTLMDFKKILFAMGAIVTIIIMLVTYALTKSALLTIMLLLFATGFSSLFIAVTIAFVIMVRDLEAQTSENKIKVAKNKYIAHNLENEFYKLYKKYAERYDNMERP